MIAIPESNHPVWYPTCGHRKYRMTCAQFDRLVERSGGNCEICRVPAEETNLGTLNIDHDPWVGEWGVRGLLCTRCNVSLMLDLMAPFRGSYLDSPFHHEIYGGHIPMPDEPPVGSTVYFRTLAYSRVADGWMGNQIRRPVSWENIWGRNGPVILDIRSGLGRPTHRQLCAILAAAERSPKEALAAA
jgi:hypothetical protein